MKTRTVTVREGERVADIDLNHESFTEEPSGDRRYNEYRIGLFREMCDGIARGEKWEATTDGGSPKVGWGPVLDVGMWDGWPYWRPMPSFLLGGYWGASWECWRALSAARKVGAS